MLEVVEFGRQLVESNDLDPVYTMLWKAEFPPEKLQKWLMAYWLFYDSGTASWLSELWTDEFWRGCQEADARKYPRGTERRHFRGKLSYNSILGLSDRPVSWYFKYATTWVNPPAKLKGVMDRVKTWPGFGDWISFKVADMLERLNLCPIDFADTDTFLFDSPKEGAEKVVEHYAKGRNVTKEFAPKWALDYLQNQLGKLSAPPRHERYLNGQEYETILCKWLSHTHGKYPIGKDSIELRHSLLRFAKVPTAQRLLKCL